MLKFVGTVALLMCFGWGFRYIISESQIGSAILMFVIGIIGYSVFFNKTLKYSILKRENRPLVYIGGLIGVIILGFIMYLLYVQFY